MTWGYVLIIFAPTFVAIVALAISTHRRIWLAERPGWVTQTWVGVLWDRARTYRVDRRHQRGDHILCRGCVKTERLDE